MEKIPENPPPPPPSSADAAPSSTAAPAKPESSNHQIHSTLKSLNKSSFKISKQSRPTPPAPLPIPSSSALSESCSASIPPAPPQPPVYNIDKNNFREIVQKLTGSTVPVPAPAPPPPRHTAPVHHPPPQATSTPRLHRIRPPPLANLSPRPPQVGSQTALSPLPPLPTVGVTAESPVSAYMRRLHGGTGTDPVLPPSPLGFGCLPSPRTAYQMMMMSTMGLPTSPGVPPLPAQSPRGEGR